MSLFIRFEEFEDLSDEQKSRILNEYPVISYDDITYICPSPKDDDCDNPSLAIAFDNTSYDCISLYSDMDDAKKNIRKRLNEQWEYEFETYFMTTEKTNSGYKLTKPVEAIKDWAKGESSELWGVYGDNFDDWVENLCDDECRLQEELSQGEEQEFKDIFMNEVACDMFTKMVTHEYQPEESDDIEFKEVEGDMFKCISIATQPNCTYESKERFDIEASVLSKLILDASLATSEHTNESSNSLASSPRF